MPIAAKTQETRGVSPPAPRHRERVTAPKPRLIEVRSLICPACPTATREPLRRWRATSSTDRVRTPRPAQSRIRVTRPRTCAASRATVEVGEEVGRRGNRYLTYESEEMA